MVLNVPSGSPKLKNCSKNINYCSSDVCFSPIHADVETRSPARVPRGFGVRRPAASSRPNVPGVLAQITEYAKHFIWCKITTRRTRRGGGAVWARPSAVTRVPGEDTKHMFHI